MARPRGTRPPGPPRGSEFGLSSKNDIYLTSSGVRRGPWRGGRILRVRRAVAARFDRTPMISALGTFQNALGRSRTS